MHTLHWQLSRRLRLRRRWPVLSPANPCAFAVFTVVHMISLPLAALQVFPPSLVFGWAWDRYQQLLPCVLLYGFYIGGYQLFLFR